MTTTDTHGVLIPAERFIHEGGRPHAEVVLVDVRGRRHEIVGDFPIAVVAPLDSIEPYEHPVFLPCVVEHDDGRTARIRTRVPARDGAVCFDVFSSIVVARARLPIVA